MNLQKKIGSLVAILSIVPTISAAPSWFTLLTDTETGEGFNRCGASLVYPDVVMATSECGFFGTYARVGYRDNYDSDHVTRLDYKRSHPSKGQVNGRPMETFPNDIELYKLKKPVRGVEPIKLYEGGMGLDDNNAHPLYFAQAGSKEDVWDPPQKDVPKGDQPDAWSLHKFGFGEHPVSSLKEGSVSLEEFRLCSKHIQDLPGYNPKIDQKLVFCTNASPNSPCDTMAWGSPLYSNETRTGETVLVGMASQGMCDPAGVPYINVRIAHYVNWIKGAICSMTDTQHDVIDCSTVDTNVQYWSRDAEEFGPFTPK